MKYPKTKALLLFALGMTATVAFANPGLYIGFYGEQDSLALDTQGGSIQNPNENLFGLAWGTYLGYNIPVYRNFSISPEVFIDYGSTGSSRTIMTPVGNAPTNSVYYTQQADLHRGIALLPSYQFNDRLMGFLRAGFVQARIEKSGANDPNVPPDYSGYQNGWQLGLGAELALNYHFHLRSEYNFTRYNNIAAGDYKIIPNEQSFLIGLTYYFTSSKPTANPYIPDENPNENLYYTPEEKPVALDYNALYFGGFGGASSMNVWNEDNVNVTPVSGASEQTNRSYDANLALRSMFYGGFIGISKAVSKHFYAAIEGDFTGGNAVNKNVSVDTNQSWELKRGYSIGTSFLPGYIINARNLLYFRSGLVWTQFSKTGDYNAATNFSYLNPGIELGFGYEFALTNWMSVRTEYDYTSYFNTTETSTQTGNGTPSNPTTTVNDSYSPSDNQFKVGLNFRI